MRFFCRCVQKALDGDESAVIADGGIENHHAVTARIRGFFDVDMRSCDVMPFDAIVVGLELSSVSKGACS